ncbi:MAG TPA: TonB-dependent receptor [Segetibacter sp.]
MCIKYFLSIFLSLPIINLKAQFVITGMVTTTKNEPLEGVNISIKGSYFGTTSAKDGSFSLSVPDTSTRILTFSFIGYKILDMRVAISSISKHLSAQLREEPSEMEAVVIAAGTFEASDKKKATALKSLDVVTTAGKQADITTAFKTLPGAQQIGEQEGLFVRGGTGAETKVFIDGMMVANPFYSSVPDIAQRSRFSPLLFKGMAFSTGGYSAQYGQALSSALILESIDLPTRSELNLIISSPQLSILSQRLNKKKNGSLGANVNYANLAPYFSVVPQKYHYTKPSEALNTDLNWRQKVRSGIIKVYAYGNLNKVGFERPGLEFPPLSEHFFISNKNFYSNATYAGKLKHNWQLYTGASVSYNADNIKMRTGKVDTTLYSFLPQITNQTSQIKFVLSKNFLGLTKLHVGSELQSLIDKVEAKDSISLREIKDTYAAAFIESDVYFTTRFVSKMGIRYEHSSLLNKGVISPRLSFAYKLNSCSQFSFAYGKFYQKPETNHLFRTPSLNFSNSSHYILNYQSVFKGQTLRIETFYKDYKALVTIEPANAFRLKNDGTGYAKGVEVFWRDMKNIKDLDYWISYTFLDTKRKHLDYPFKTQPSFSAKHTVSVVAKVWVNSISTHFSSTYSFATGRPFYNPNLSRENFMSEKTMNFNSLGLQANYLKRFGKVNAVLIANVSNALGSNQVFGYRYSGKINSRGEYAREEITPMAKRVIFLGMYLSIGADKRNSIID